MSISSVHLPRASSVRIRSEGWRTMIVFAVLCNLLRSRSSTPYNHSRRGIPSWVVHSFPTNPSTCSLHRTIRTRFKVPRGSRRQAETDSNDHHADSSKETKTTTTKPSKSQQGITILHFRAQKTFRSPPIALQRTMTPSENERTPTFFYDFFAMNQTCSTILSGSNSMVTQVFMNEEDNENETAFESNFPLPITRMDKKQIQPLIRSWKRECRLLNSDEPQGMIPVWTTDPTTLPPPSSPNHMERIYCVQTSGMNFPGLKVISFLWIGSLLKMSLHRQDHDSMMNTTETTQFPLPEYQFVLIQSENRVEGPKILQWIYHQLTSSGSRAKLAKQVPPPKDKEEESVEEEDSPRSNVHSLSRTTMEISETLDSFVFRTDAMIDIEIRFPSILLKILPVSQEKAEQQGSMAVSSTIDKDVVPALQRLAHLYSEWISSRKDL